MNDYDLADIRDIMKMMKLSMEEIEKGNSQQVALWQLILRDSATIAMIAEKAMKRDRS